MRFSCSKNTQQVRGAIGSCFNGIKRAHTFSNFYSTLVLIIYLNRNIIIVICTWSNILQENATGITSEGKLNIRCRTNKHYIIILIKNSSSVMADGIAGWRNGDQFFMMTGNKNGQNGRNDY